MTIEITNPSALSREKHATQTTSLLRSKLNEIFQRILNKFAAAIPGGYWLRPRLHRMRGVNIGENVWISQFVYIDELHPEAVTIGKNCTIGLRASIFSHFYYGPKRSIEHAGPVVIEDDVFIGPHCVILPNVRIGRGSVIKAGTVVTHNVPPGVFWGTPSAGALARVSVPMTPQNSYEEFLGGLKPIRIKKQPLDAKALPLENPVERDH